MKEDRKLDANKIHLLKVDIVRATIENSSNAGLSDLKGFHFDLNFKLGTNPENSLVKTELEISVNTDVKDMAVNATCEFTLSFVFKVDNFKDLVYLNDDQIEVGDELALTLSNITYSTSRGILLTRLQGTIFKDFILPIMNPRKLVKKQGSPQKKLETDIH